MYTFFFSVYSSQNMEIGVVCGKQNEKRSCLEPYINLISKFETKPIGWFLLLYQSFAVVFDKQDENKSAKDFPGN